MTVRSCRMMEAEMYGMIPRAKIVSRLRLPPENRSRNPRIPPPCCRKNDSSAWKLIPGTGMWPPTRYTASIRKVKTTRFLRSGMLKMFLIDSNMPAPLRARRRGDGLGASPGPGDLLQGRLAEAVRLDDDGPGDLALQRVERAEVDHRVFLAEQVREPALRNAALQRHLAALEAEVLLAPRARQLPLVARRGGLAVPGARTAADPLRLPARPLGRLETRQVEATRHDCPPRFSPDAGWR